MSPLAEILRLEILRAGPISFHRFMEAALYDPQFGYYRRRLGIDDASTPAGPTSARDPCGMPGDFFTAEQLQPVFGILIAERMRQVRPRSGDPRARTIGEMGAGRGERAARCS